MDNVISMAPKETKRSPLDIVTDDVAATYERLLATYNSSDPKADIMCKFQILEMAAVLTHGLGHDHS